MLPCTRMVTGEGGTGFGTEYGTGFRTVSGSTSRGILPSGHGSAGSLACVSAGCLACGAAPRGGRAGAGALQEVPGVSLSPLISSAPDASSAMA